MAPNNGPDHGESGSAAILIVAIFALLVAVLAGVALTVGPPDFLRDAAEDRGLIEWTPTPVNSSMVSR